MMLICLINDEERLVVLIVMWVLVVVENIIDRSYMVKMGVIKSRVRVCLLWINLVKICLVMVKLCMCVYFLFGF